LKDILKFCDKNYCDFKSGSSKGCKSHWVRLLSVPDHETNLGDFEIIYCKECEIGFTNPQPTEKTVHLLYDKKNSSDFDLIKKSFIDKIKDFLGLIALKKISKNSDIKNVLDFATGNGRFAFLSRKAFPLAHIDAVDYQSNPPELLKTRSTFLRYQSFSEFKWTKKYDLIFLRHVLEHSHRPVDLLKKLASVLSRGGVIYVEVPNLNSGCAKFFGRNWKGFYVPRHINHFTKKSLTDVCLKAGLNPEIGENEMPLMGNTLAIVFNLDQSNFFVKIAGILLHPIQMIIEFWYRSSLCVNAKCSLPDD
jgi:2-polyprenyl-3-methyl-5-hydroxy-6-metoxy-1,4-benzoquinol methylase